MPPYRKTNWINDTTKLNATNMNHIEDGIETVDIKSTILEYETSVATSVEMPLYARTWFEPAELADPIGTEEQPVTESFAEISLASIQIENPINEISVINTNLEPIKEVNLTFVDSEFGPTVKM